MHILLQVSKTHAYLTHFVLIFSLDKTNVMSSVQLTVQLMGSLPEYHWKKAKILTFVLHLYYAILSSPLPPMLCYFLFPALDVSRILRRQTCSNNSNKLTSKKNNSPILMSCGFVESQWFRIKIALLWSHRATHTS